ncbi:hypothetical protein ES703_124518 [subsurface metagenome]
MLNIEVPDTLGVGLDKGFTGWNLSAHQDMEYPVSLGNIVYVHCQQGAGSWVHGRFP